MKPMKRWLLSLLLALAAAQFAAPAAFAQTLDEAARQAARQHNAKVLSARTVSKGKQRVHVIKLLTKDGVVKTVRVPVRGK
jgi:uncharacterized protein YbaP (TraB family)